MDNRQQTSIHTSQADPLAVACQDGDAMTAAFDMLALGSNAPCNDSATITPGVDCEIIPGRLSFAMHRDEDETRAAISAHPDLFYFSSWMQESYEPFNSDFGPVNLAAVLRFCDCVLERMRDKRLRRRHLVYYCDKKSAHATNTALLLGAYLVLVEKWTAADAAKPFHALEPSVVKAFRDVSSSPSTFDLGIADCLGGLQQAVACGFLSYEGFDVDTYEALGAPECGDAHVMCPKFVALRGPCSDSALAHPPAHYLGLFAELGVSTVVRLNEAHYDKAEFEAAGLSHRDLFFDDCTSPSPDLVRRFLRICDAAPGMVAVHCYAGLGRTGTLIAAWIMAHYGWTARQAIAWLRIVRPGSVIGPQQHFLELWERLLCKAEASAECAELASSRREASTTAAEVATASDRRRQTGSNKQSRRVSLST